MPILARILKDRGIITERQLQEAIQHQVLYGGRLGTSLHELGFITEERLTEALAKAHGVPCVSVDPRKIQPEVVALVAKATAARYKVFPYELRGKTLFLLMVDPRDHLAVARIGYSLGYIVRTLVVPEFRMIQLLHDYYGIDERWRFTDTHRPERPPVVPPDKDQAVARLEAAESRDEVVEATLALCHHYFRRVVFFIVREPWLLGWTGAGEGMDEGLAQGLRIPLDQPSIFRARERAFRPPGGQAHRHQRRAAADPRQGARGEPDLRRRRPGGQRQGQPGRPDDPAAEGAPRLPAHHPEARGRDAQGHRGGPRGQSRGEREGMSERMKEIRRRRKRREEARKAVRRAGRAASSAAKKPVKR